MAHQREIVVQNEMEDIFVIKKGVDVDDKIVLEGVRQVRDGEKVEYEFRPPDDSLDTKKTGRNDDGQPRIRSGGSKPVWVDYDNNLWVFHAGTAFLVLSLYAVKEAALQFAGRTGLAGSMFAAAVFLCVPITWVLSPDWDNEFVLPAGVYVGCPIMVLTVPTASFAFDLPRRASDRLGEWRWRIPLEVFVGIPAWACCWGSSNWSR